MEPGDLYVRRIAAFIRDNELALAQAGAHRRRRRPEPQSSVFNPLAWFSTAPSAPPKPVILALDTHRLFYLLIRIEALSIDVGSLDVQVDSPSRPLNYINLFPDADKSDALSLASFRSSLSAVSGLSLGPAWWGRQEPPTVDQELKYIFSSCTKLPALSITAPGPKLIAELANEPPNENALPLDAFKTLQILECLDIDPRALLGWDRLAESLRSLTIKRSGLEDVSDIFISAVQDDQARRAGDPGHSRRRRIPHGPSRQPSFQSTPLPESVPEDAEDTPTLEMDTPLPTPTPDSTRQLPSLKWAFLQHLSLADNALTFFPADILPYLTAVTHLDLSSNLLVSVPPGLAALPALTALNLADNMIDSVLGIYTRLGALTTLNLSANRLESLCGLERLRALERVDLRHNAIEEAAEVGRLATLPHIADVAVEGNPLVEYEETYRVACFEYFWREGKTITLDGIPPGFSERRNLPVRPPEQMSSSRPPSTAHSPPVVAVGSPGQHPSPSLAPPGSPAALGKPRRKKNKRIVDLDGHETEQSEGSDMRSGPHSRVGTEGNARHRKAASKMDAAPPPQPSPRNNHVRVRSASPEPIAAAPAVEPEPEPAPVRRSRHSRYHTEIALPVSPTLEAAVPPRTGSMRHSRRRTSVSAVYDPPEADVEGQVREADAYRARIEALRADMGDGWLKVFTQSQLGSAGVASG